MLACESLGKPQPCLEHISHRNSKKIVFPRERHMKVGLWSMKVDELHVSESEWRDSVLVEYFCHRPTPFLHHFRSCQL